MEGNFDAILSHIGTGKWNFFYYVIAAYWYACICCQALGSAFFAPPIPHTCIVPDSAGVIVRLDSGDLLQNSTQNSTTYSTESKQSSCTYQVQNVTSGEITEEVCTAWDFDNSTFSSTVTSEFDLVCSREFFRATYQSIYMMGVLVGAAIGGYMADRYGRKKVIAVGVVWYSLMAMISSWLPSISTILAARFLLGMMHPTTLQSFYILAMEVTEPKMRSVIGMMQFLSWAIATMVLGGWAYQIRDWRWLQLVVSLPTILYFPLLWIMDESPRWLIVMGHYKEAMRVLQKAAHWNKTELPSEDKLLTVMKEINNGMGDEKESDAEVPLKTRLKRMLGEAGILFRTPKLRFISLILIVDYFVVAMVYYGLSLSGGSFSFDPFLFMVISGVVEIPTCTVTIPIAAKLGRKGPLIASYFATGATMLVQPLISENYMWLIITTVMTGKLAITNVYQFLALFSAELFPTEVRTRGMSMGMMSSRVGAMVSPYLLSSIGAKYPWTTPVVFGITSIIAGLVTLPLRDTLHTALPDTVAHLEGHTNQALELNEDSDKTNKRVSTEAS